MTVDSIRIGQTVVHSAPVGPEAEGTDSEV